MRTDALLSLKADIGLKWPKMAIFEVFHEKKIILGTLFLMEEVKNFSAHCPVCPYTAY